MQGLNNSNSNHSNSKYSEMQANHPIYEGLDPNIGNYNSSSTANYEGVQYSNVTDIDPNFFTGNDYDNAAAPVSRTPAGGRTMNSYKNTYVNGNGPIITNMATKFDRNVSLKTNTLSPPVATPQSAAVVQNPNATNSVKFENIRKSCFASKTLFQDPDFPPNERSLYATRKANFSVAWMRPAEIVNIFNQTHGKNLHPEMVVRGFETCDLNQGSLGDCWVVAALACLTCHDFERHFILSRLIPPGQSFRMGLYFGAFLFRFWRNGEWVEVIIDDLLPTHDGRLIYISSNQPNEFWGALVEKAYAKLNGSYEALDSGQLADALDDFTGGMTEYYSLDPNINVSNKGLLANIDDQLIKAYERHSLITAGILNKQTVGSIKTTTGTIMQNGLIAGHAYTISDIRKIKLTDNSKMQSVVTLVRVRNPWGIEIEWNGPWSDKSSEWLSISDADKKSVGLVRKADGEFWISMTDFLNNFDTLDICHLALQQNVKGVKKKNHWNSMSFFGEWKVGVSAGGRPKLVNSHFMNPQFRIDLKESADNNKCSVIIGLLQEDPRGAEPKVAARGNLSIGFVIYQLKSKDIQIPLRREYFAINTFVASVDSFINSREVVKRFNLSIGSYLIVPCTYDVNQEGRFLLRIFMESVNNNLQSTENIPITNQLESRLDPQKEIIVRQMFYRESGNEMALTAFQLQRLINWYLRDAGFKYELNIEACKAIVVLFDQSTGKTESTFKFSEEHFTAMLGWLLRCLKQIQSADLIGPVALQKSLDNLQLSVSNQVIQNLIHKFCNESGSISVSGFITIVAIISKTNDSFDFFQRNNVVSLTREEFLSIATKL